MTIAVRRRDRGAGVDAGIELAPVLEFDDVYAGYSQFQALFGVSFTVGRGQAVALIGPNGVGKTTVARVASGLVAPTSGRVVVSGRT